MGSQPIPILLVTANVGSIFEDHDQMLKIWCEEFLSTVSKLDPKFIALHCQEVGGKNYDKSMKHVEYFVKLLMSSNELRLFDKVRVYLDEDYSSVENFTALGNLYFIHESIDNCLIWDFKELKFLSVQGKEIYSGNIESVTTKEKAKFPQDYFPECKWSRKGFLRTRWSLSGTVIDLVNIHLFHDASNFVAMETYPSVYCKNRRRALEHTLQKFHNDTYGKVPYFVFGDFNFRTDTDSVIKKLTEGLNTTRQQNNKNNECTKLQYLNDDSELVLTVGKKEFKHLDHENIFLTPFPSWLKCLDKEMEAFENHIMEFPINFPPSYPFEENILKPKSYMQTRCPSWCDRILFSHTAKQLIDNENNINYGLIGLDICMGDHKPVYLNAELRPNSGIVNCCNHTPYECLPATCKCCQSFANVTINVVDMSDYLYNKGYQNNPLIDLKYLHEPILNRYLQEPYTPESAESHSPSITIKEQLINDKIIVTPEQLRKRLENVLNSSPKVIKRSQSDNVDLKITNNNIITRNRAMSEVHTQPKIKLTSTDNCFPYNKTINNYTDNQKTNTRKNYNNNNCCYII